MNLTAFLPILTPIHFLDDRLFYYRQFVQKKQYIIFLSKPLSLQMQKHISGFG